MLNVFLLGAATGVIIGWAASAKTQRARRKLARKISRAIRGR